MITKEQCRAARNFLGLKQSELASDCGLSKTAITHFESGLFHPRAENMANIRAALEKRGIEFVGTYGIQKRQTLFQLLEGEILAAFLEGSEVMLNGVEVGRVRRQEEQRGASGSDELRRLGRFVKRGIIEDDEMLGVEAWA